MLPVLSLVAAVSCGGGREKEPDGGDMLQYAPQINEVEVMRLERTDFQWQLLANGRLVASVRSALPFRTAGVLTELNVRNGQRVSAGDVLARQDSREKRLALEAAQISFDRAELQGILSKRRSSISRGLCLQLRSRESWQMWPTGVMT